MSNEVVCTVLVRTNGVPCGRLTLVPDVIPVVTNPLVSFVPAWTKRQDGALELTELSIVLRSPTEEAELEVRLDDEPLEKSGPMRYVIVGLMWCSLVCWFLSALAALCGLAWTTTLFGESSAFAATHCLGQSMILAVMGAATWRLRGVWCPS